MDWQENSKNPILKKKDAIFSRLKSLGAQGVTQSEKHLMKISFIFIL